MDRSLTTVILLSFGLAAVSYGILAAFLAFVARSSEMGGAPGLCCRRGALRTMGGFRGSVRRYGRQPFFGWPVP